MKHIKQLNEGWEIQTPDDADLSEIEDLCFKILREELSEKTDEILKRAELVMEKQLDENKQAFAHIIANCKQRKFRRQYAAESVYQELVKGRISALLERDWVNGGLKK